MKKKKPFLLIEVLIALFLVTLIAIPLLTKPIFMYRSEMATLEEMERERLAAWTFVEIKEDLLNNKIAWEKLPKERGKNHFSLSSGFIYLPESNPKRIERSFTLSCSTGKEKDGTDDALYRLLKVNIFLDKKKEPYTYSVIVKKESDKKKPVAD